MPCSSGHNSLGTLPSSFSPIKIFSLPNHFAAFSFRFYFFLKTFLVPRLIRLPHKFVAAFARLSNQHVARGSDNFLHWPQIGKERLFSGHVKG
jgi:hypothetical protein